MIFDIEYYQRCIKRGKQMFKWLMLSMIGLMVFAIVAAKMMPDRFPDDGVVVPLSAFIGFMVGYVVFRGIEIGEFNAGRRRE